MANIKFSHLYNKLKDGNGQAIKTARLLLAVPVSNDEIRQKKDFIDYDTDNGKYTLTYSSWYLMLLFQKPNGDLFTTVRPRWNRNGDKKPYYDGLIGQELQIVITQEVHHG